MGLWRGAKSRPASRSTPQRALKEFYTPTHEDAGAWDGSRLLSARQNASSPVRGKKEGRRVKREAAKSDFAPIQGRQTSIRASVQLLTPTNKKKRTSERKVLFSYIYQNGNFILPTPPSVLQQIPQAQELQQQKQPSFFWNDAYALPSSLLFL